MSKPITNQRTKEEIREIVKDTDKSVPDGKEFVDIMEGKQPATPTEEPTTEPVQTIVEEEPTPVEENPDEITTLQDPEETPVEEEPTPAVEEGDDEEPTPQTQKLPPVEKRYKEAAQEAMVLNSKNRKILDTIEEAQNIEEPTEEEVRAYAKDLGEDYDNLEPFAQNLLKRNLKTERQFGKIGGLVEEERRLAQWQDEVSTFVDSEEVSQKYAPLANRKEEFIKYASKKSHIGADLDLLVAGFMWKQDPVKRKKNVLLPSGTGGANSKPKLPSAPTEMDAKADRTRDQKTYMQNIKKKKYKSTIK